jgi:hypothetical protein
MSAYFDMAAGVGMTPALVPDGNMPGAGYNYFVFRVASVVFPDKGAACKRDCQHGSYDGHY